MNQILSVENNYKKKSKNKGPLEIKTIIRFFSIAMLIFGCFTIGSGSYSIYKNSSEGVTEEKPGITLSEGSSENMVNLQITHNRELSKVEYNWNDEEKVSIDCSGKKKINEEIEKPKGTNTLSVYVSDINGIETTMSREYERDAGIQIDITAESNGIKVVAQSESQLKYMTYKWDDEEAQRVDINDTKIEQVIDIPKGLHEITIEVYNEYDQKQVKTQEVQGVTKPKLEVTTDGEYFFIKASDEEGINRIEFIINETDKKKIDLYKVRSLEERKEFEYSYPLKQGENILEIRIYNESNVSEVKKVLFRK